MDWSSRFWIQLILLSVSVSILLIFLFYILNEDINELKKKSNSTSSSTSSSSSSSSTNNDIDMLIFLKYLVGLSAILLLLTILTKIYTRYFLRNTFHHPSLSSSSSSSSYNISNLLITGNRPRRISNIHLDLMLRELTSADYELLQRLDDDIENKNQHQATEYEIGRLPSFTITKKDIECHSIENKSCAICLESFEVNNIVRILPCLHRYHIQCIDTWLRQHATCPVCKFPVTVNDVV